MSLTSSLSSAVTGLGLTARRAEMIASNVANADTPGYAARRLATNGPVTGIPNAGTAVTRSLDANLLAMRRDAESRSAGASIDQSFQTRIDGMIGDPGQGGSLQDLLARLDASLTTAAADPTSVTRLATVARGAQDLTDKINALGDAVTVERQSSEGRIAKTVDRLNTDLSLVERLNSNIVRMQATGNDPSNLVDQRQLVIDRISQDIPLREMQRDNGTVALVSQGGALLLDGRAAKIEFVANPLVQPGMAYPIALSGLTLNGRDVGTATPGSELAGGGLGALFALRDEAAPEAMARLDTFAADLAERFQDPTVDPSLAGAMPGLFTDAGSTFAAVNMVGLSSRLTLNASVAPDGAAETWRLRDGVAAAIPGAASNPAQLLRFSDALSGPRLPAGGALGSTARSTSDLASVLRSTLSSDRVAADDRMAVAGAERDTLVALRDGGKVDIDGEMRRLIEVEQAYAANARIIQAVDQMMNRLTEI
ncbi:MAG: flagellar basal body rod C-terminal domain-containing protein [Jannaschia sp.]